MKCKFLYLIILFFITIYTSTGQTLSKIESIALFSKYSAAPNEDKISAHTPLVLVKLSRPLTAAELDRFKPLRNFSIDHLVIKEAFAQQLSGIILEKAEVNALWKAGDRLSRVYEEYLGQPKMFPVKIAFNPQATDISGLLDALKAYKIDYRNSVITAEIPMSALMPLLLQEAVLFADLVQQAREEITVPGLDLSVNEISAVHQLYPEINGNGITVSLKEGMFDPLDIDLSANLSALPPNLPAVTNHATIMATLILGRGNSFILGRGAAPFTKLTTADFSNLMPDDIKQLNTFRVNVQNHSYGTDLDNIYGIEAAAYDQQVFEADTLIHVFSSGNKGTTTPVSGIYKGISNTANLTGNFKQAKNVLVIGGINKENIPESLSSRGPAYDGRVKPELVALGEDGTSGAAALTSGVVALLQQAYKNSNVKQPPAALIKSILINSADDQGKPQVDHITGFGKVNALASLKTIMETRFRTAAVAQDQEYTFPLQVEAGQKEIKVTLAWTDPPAMIGSAQSIVNHLDLSLETPAGAVILPWVLSSYPNPDSLALPATRRADDTNTVQQLSLEDMPAGNYTVHVKGRKVIQPRQQFAFAYQFKPADNFTWTFPEKDDDLFAGEDNYLRWANSFSKQAGKLSVSYDSGISWAILSGNVSLDASFFKWNTPGLFTTALLKMETGGKEYISKSFKISSPLSLSVGYNCDDKLLLHWKPQPSATGYTLFNLKNNTLSEIAQLRDTVIILDKPTLSSPYLAISANGNGFSGLKSYTIDYTTQGVSCYIRTFTASLSENTIKLDLALGTTFNLKRIVWEKQASHGIFTVLAETGTTNGLLNYMETDSRPNFGPQFYRVTFETLDGLIIHSDLVRINFLKEADFVTYPNPVSDYLFVLSGDFQSYTFSVFNLSGQKVIQEEATGAKQVNVSSLVTGIYIGVISRNGVILKRIKMIKK